MSDWNDITEEDFLLRLLHSYHHIAITVSLLPLPLTLPPVRNGAHFTDFIDAIARTAEISEDIHAPEDVQAALFTGCLHWLTAIDLFNAHLNEPKEYRAEAITMNILCAERCLDPVIEWLATDS